SPRASLDGKVAEEVWTYNDVSFDHLKIFGCPAYVHIPADERSKLDAKSKKYTFLGYKKDSDKVQVELEHVPAVLDKGESSSSSPDDVDHDVSGPTDVPESYKLARDRVRRTNIQAPETVSCENNDRWKAAMEEEMNSVHKNQTWELDVLPKGKKAIGCWWIYTRKSSVTEKGGLIAAKNMHDIIDLKGLLSQEFEMKDLGVAKKILGMEIRRDRGSKKLWLSQKGYVEKVLQRFGMNEAKPVGTPLANHFKLSVDMRPKSDKETQDMVEIPYAIVVGCLMYSMVCTRPDLAHVVGQVCK
ncbi:Uncharacterized mitochondrial protein AtMg00810, partial [Striga hermonthica]